MKIAYEKGGERGREGGREKKTALAFRQWWWIALSCIHVLKYVFPFACHSLRFGSARTKRQERKWREEPKRMMLSLATSSQTKQKTFARG